MCEPGTEEYRRHYGNYGTADNQPASSGVATEEQPTNILETHRRKPGTRAYQIAHNGSYGTPDGKPNETPAENAEWRAALRRSAIEELRKARDAAQEFLDVSGDETEDTISEVFAEDLEHESDYVGRPGYTMDLYFETIPPAKEPAAAPSTG